LLVGLTEREARRGRTPTITAIRSRIRESRDARAARSALERELSSYNSQSDLDDLHAILDRYNDRETVQIRRILAAQRIR
jgi:hypothetical protein